MDKIVRIPHLRIRRCLSISSVLNKKSANRKDINSSNSPLLNKKSLNRKDINNRLYDLLDNMDKEEVNLANAMSVRVEKRPKMKIKNIYPQKQPSTIFWQVISAAHQYILVKELLSFSKSLTLKYVSTHPHKHLKGSRPTRRLDMFPYQRLWN